MGNQQLTIENPTTIPQKGDRGTNDEIVARAERRFNTIYASMRDAYGDEDGHQMFRMVILSPQKYMNDKRRLIQSLAREGLMEQSRVGEAASGAEKVSLLKDFLVNLFMAFEGDSWREKLPGWSPENRRVTVTKWHGVSIEKGLLTGLKLVHNNMKGNVEKVFELLGNLQVVGGVCAIQEINFASNNLKGSLNSEHLSKLASLIVFCLPFNSITGEIPDFSANKGLAVLSLQSNHLQGSIPMSICECRNLRVVHLYSNNLTGPIPSELAQLEQLVELRLWDNNLTGTIPGSLFALSKLKVFHLAQNKLTGQIPLELFQGLESLEYLFLNDNRLTGSIPIDGLVSLPKIKSIHLSHNQFEDIQEANTSLQKSFSSRHAEVDILGQDLVYYGNEYPIAQRGETLPKTFSDETLDSIAQSSNPLALAE